ncbi:MAG: SDR family NAD(P)-dependent oxidoreductase [Actinomycetota bacterium]|nr:SDR family NAD(P)-dependent oxidoreductase [Actinomycetota bacterium]
MATVMPLKGRVALVTGASRRIAIGAGIARRLATDGASVLVHAWPPHDAEQPWGSDEGGTEALVSELRRQGGQVEPVFADLADADAPAQLIDAARNAFGHLDVVVANHARGSGQALEDLTAEEIDLTYAVNTRATLLLVKAFAAHHDSRPGGRVVLFTSGQCHGAMPSELADWVTGQVIASDGGWSAAGQ